MSLHTPGPWTASPRSSVVGQAVMAGNVLVAAVPSGEPNALLIAASPNLLETLEALAPLIDSIDEMCLHSVGGPLVPKIRTAIARTRCPMCATGRDDLVAGEVGPPIRRGPAGNWDHPSISVPGLYATCFASAVLR
jgi:hypothetical protein